MFTLHNVPKAQIVILIVDEHAFEMIFWITFEKCWVVMFLAVLRIKLGNNKQQIITFNNVL